MTKSQFEEARSLFSDETYAAIGRILAFATRFEANCRALAALDGFKQATRNAAMGPGSEGSDEMFARLVTEYWEARRMRHHAQSIALRYKLPPDLRKTIRKGREARNVVAHELTLGLPHDIESDSGRAHILSEVRAVTRFIAEADRFVALLIHLENDDSPPSVSHYDSYVARAEAWVCDVESESRQV